MIAIVQGFREPVCIKRELVALLGPFERFCLMPQAINKCFDWDIFDTRWARVGLTVSEAYRCRAACCRAACCRAACCLAASRVAPRLPLHPLPQRRDLSFLPPPCRSGYRAVTGRVQSGYRAVTERLRSDVS